MKNKTAFAVGLFMIVGIVIAIAAIIWLGMSNYFEKGQNYVAFFDESVQGLDKDSPVKYRGVSIGRVHSVGVAPDGTLIEVILAIEDDVRLESDMYAQLKSVGITGIMFIEIDRKKEGKSDYYPRISFYTEYPIIVTKPSGIKMLMDGMDAVLEIVNKLDTEGIAEKLKSGADKIYQVFNDAQIEEVSSNLRSSISKIDKMLDIEKWNRIMDSVENAAASLNSLTANSNETVSNIDKNVNTIADSANKTVRNLNKKINAIAENANKTVRNISKTVVGIERIVSDNEMAIHEAISGLNVSMKNADALLEEGTGLIKNSDAKFSTLQRHLLVTLENLEKASENLSNLLEVLADQPSQLILGEPLPPREIGN